MATVFIHEMTFRKSFSISLHFEKWIDEKMQNTINHKIALHSCHKERGKKRLNLFHSLSSFDNMMVTSSSYSQDSPLLHSWTKSRSHYSRHHSNQPVNTSMQQGKRRKSSQGFLQWLNRKSIISIDFCLRFSK